MYILLNTDLRRKKNKLNNNKGAYCRNYGTSLNWYAADSLIHALVG